MKKSLTSLWSFTVAKGNSLNHEMMITLNFTSNLTSLQISNQKQKLGLQLMLTVKGSQFYYLMSCNKLILFKYSSCVRVVMSDRPGMGKSFYIKQMARKLKQSLRRSASKCTITIHGPEVTPDTVMDFLSNHLRDPSCCMYHIDVASDVSFYYYISTINYII